MAIQRYNLSVTLLMVVTVCDSMVRLDALLHDTLVSRGDYVETLRWDELVSRCLAKMTPVHCVTFASAETQIHRGRLEPIELDVVQRGSNKKVSSVHFFSTVNAVIHIHTFNGPLSGTTQVNRYQKGKINLDFTEARDSEW